MYRSADITNLLISVFDDTEPITREIQNQMGVKLLNKTDFETETEVVFNAILFKVVSSDFDSNYVCNIPY